jgi:hypothetical protein
VTIAQAFRLVLIVGVTYMGFCALFTVFWSLLMRHNKRCYRRVDREHFQAHLDRCSKTVDSWPRWKRNMLSPHKKENDDENEA